VRIRPSAIGNVSHQLIQAHACNLGREIPRIIETQVYASSDGVARSPGDRVVKLTLEQCSPRVMKNWAMIATTRSECQGGEWLGQPAQ
jgi:hypothetical protein